MTNQQKITEAHDATTLIASIRASHDTTSVVKTTLKTHERVIARVTDGIYRQPASALRELISNAYDADAERVVIKTDAPRFERITVEDDGHGMSPEALAYLLQNIGGSAKRRDEGAALGMTSSTDSSLSPGGRRLIGKIGIGLFSVSQLTHSFQIITKTKGDNYRTVATVVMRQYSDEDSQASTDGEEQYESGKVHIWREKAADVDVQGTTIVLNNIRRQAKETLRSQEIWTLVDENDGTPTEDQQNVEPPRFHIGRVDLSGDVLKNTKNGSGSALPWTDTDSPSYAFEKLVKSVWAQVDAGNPNPKLENIFDYYLRMAWQLSLAVPLPYVEGHLFEEPSRGWAKSFLLSNNPKGAPTEISGSLNKPIREVAALSEPRPANIPFGVLFDGLELRRPVRYRNLPITHSALKEPIVFIGKCSEEFKRVPEELSGGPLEFEAYLFWSPKIAPVEHQGSLIRIHGASGTLFDPTFMRYQVQEIQRLKQITCEIFVTRGLDSALNIDRESFNSAHPHSVFITKWLHSALRQLASTQKRLASEVRVVVRGERQSTALSNIQRVADDIWRSQSGDPSSEPPDIELRPKDHDPSGDSTGYVFDRSAVVPEASRTQGARARTQSSVLEEKVKAVAQVLASFGLLESMPKHKQEALLRAIYEIMEAPGE